MLPASQRWCFSPISATSGNRSSSSLISGMTPPNECAAPGTFLRAHSSELPLDRHGRTLWPHPHAHRECGASMVRFSLSGESTLGARGVPRSLTNFYRRQPGTIRCLLGATRSTHRRNDAGRFLAHTSRMALLTILTALFHLTSRSQRCPSIPRGSLSAGGTIGRRRAFREDTLSQ
jgi:hypothetical protein